MAVDHSLEVDRERGSAGGSSAKDDDGYRRTGTLSTCVAHIITSVIGSGVLSLAWSTAQLGWVGGPLSMLFFAFVTYASASLLSECYRTPDGAGRNKSYMDAVRTFLGNKQPWLCGLLQYLSMYGTGVVYTLTTAISMRAILKSNCYHFHGRDSPCHAFGNTVYMVAFGVVQIACSLIPDFHNMAWLSTVAAIMSFTYSSIGFGLGLAKTAANGGFRGSIYGVPAPTTAQKVWTVSQALGDIAFSYPYSLILLEIQDTLRSPPKESTTMKRASAISVLATTFFYLGCGCFGYAAFGDEGTPGNLLTGFGFYEPFWLVDFANACIVLHLIGGYQIYSQPVFSFIERWFAAKFPSTAFFQITGSTKPAAPQGKTASVDFGSAFTKTVRGISPFRLCYRAIYVASTTGLAILFPYFNQVLGVLGALNFWPLAIYFPVEMYIVQKKVPAWSRQWIALRSFSLVCLVISLFTLVGSIEGVIREKLR